MVIVDDNNDLELDPQLWKELPQELLERVITKLPFSRVVAFRTVCKDWYSDIIPRAAPHIQASSQSALLYFGYLDKKSESTAWWSQVCNTNREWTNSLEEFQPDSFPSPRTGEVVRLMICEQGLLFFGFISRELKMVRDIVVCNPLTSQTKCLGLPVPLQLPGNDAHLLVGVVFNSRAGSYCFVAAGLDSACHHATFLYDSVTITWTKGLSILPALLEVGEGVVLKQTRGRRSVCLNGNLYWCTEGRCTDRRLRIHERLIKMVYVIKFDLQLGTWRLISLPGMSVCPEAVTACQIACYEGKIFLWHLHRCDLYDEFIDFSSRQLVYMNYGRYQQPRGWRCRHDIKLELAPAISLMHQYERIGGLLPQVTCAIDYFTFSHQNTIHHVLRQMHKDASSSSGLVLETKMVIQDMIANSRTELTVLPLESFPPVLEISAKNFWNFAASLTSLP